MSVVFRAAKLANGRSFKTRNASSWGEDENNVVVLHRGTWLFVRPLRAGAITFGTRGRPASAVTTGSSGLDPKQWARGDSCHCRAPRAKRAKRTPDHSSRGKRRSTKF